MIVLASFATSCLASSAMPTVRCVFLALVAALRGVDANAISSRFTLVAVMLTAAHRSVSQAVNRRWTTSCCSMAGQSTALGGTACNYETQ